MKNKILPWAPVVGMVLILASGRIANAGATASAGSEEGKVLGPAAGAKEDCDKDPKTKADEKLKAELDTKQAEAKAAEAKALQKLGLLNAQKPVEPSAVLPTAAKMETCK